MGTDTFARPVPRLPIVLLAAVAACTSSVSPATSRTYRLGFSATPPQLNIQSVLATIDAFRPHADIALITQSVPWRALLADTAAPFLVRRDLRELAQLYRSRNLPIILQVDVTDGLSRDKEAPELIALGRSISEPAVQAVYREYVLAVDSIVKPDYLGLAMETNLVRAIAPASVYAAVKTMTANVEVALSAQASTAKRFISVQVETAWGLLPGNGGQFRGIEPDRDDFPFIQVLGLSSYPYLGGFQEPEEVPIEYYDRLNEFGRPELPLLVVEGGWTSASVPGVTSSGDKQARWIKRQVQLADYGSLAAVTQITFTDLDLSTYPVPQGSILPLFAFLGLVDVDFKAKPALAEWDKVFQRSLRP